MLTPVWPINLALNAHVCRSRPSPECITATVTAASAASEAGSGPTANLTRRCMRLPGERHAALLDLTGAELQHWRLCCSAHHQPDLPLVRFGPDRISALATPGSPKAFHSHRA